MVTVSDAPDQIEASQERVLAAYERTPDVTCEACDTLIMQVYSIYGGWLWLAVYGQDGTPAAQCPNVPGLYGIGHGAHRPKTA